MIGYLSDDELLARIRGKLASGELPVRMAVEAFGGRSSGRACSGCGELIAASSAEIDSTGADDDKQWFFHGRCYALLTAEQLAR